MIFTRNQKILFIGDSITDTGRRGEPHAPYGRGYVHLTRAFLLARYPELDLQILNRGISGNTVRDLAARWENDVIAEQPDWLSIKIGINDDWRLIANRVQEHVPLDEYEQTYRSLLENTKQRSSHTHLTLIEPYVIAPPTSGPNALSLSLADVQQRYPQLREQGVNSGPEYDACLAQFRAVMDQYCAVVERLAGEYSAVLVHTQAAFDEALQFQPPAYWAADRVHPDAPGHAVIARAFLRAVDYGDV
ncbi:MAG TPA: SGNH/GDSL hydrolase family protein [Chloroflexota bacterium]|nr:SGNH/GDSL hydrolase family protein [Chloroflexota bacterium]